MRFVLALLSIAALVQNGNPLFPKAAPRHLAVTTSASAAAVKIGGKVTLFVDISPNPGIRVYAPGAKDYQVIAVSLDPASGVATAGKPVYPKSEILFFEPLNERVPVFQQPFRITQPIAVMRAPKNGNTATVNGTLTYQACDDKVCYAPASVPVSWTLTVS